MVTGSFRHNLVGSSVQEADTFFQRDSFRCLADRTENRVARIVKLLKNAQRNSSRLVLFGGDLLERHDSRVTTKRNTLLRL